MWTDFVSPIIIAHRGDRANAPENTLAAFKQAEEKGANAIEFDVKLTGDGEVIVLHDQTVDRTTDGYGNVAQYSLQALQQLDANVQFPEIFSDIRIPTLREVFESTDQRLHLNIELTNYATPRDDLVSRVAELIKKHGMQGRVLFSSFLPRNLRKASVLLPKVPRGLLTMPGLLGLWGRTISWRGDYFALHPHFSDANPGMIDRVHTAGKRINVWTVNTEQEIKRMIGLGVNGIITDDPALALNLLGKVM